MKEPTPKKVAIQRGHYGLLRGETGGPDEMEFNSEVALLVKMLLEKQSLQVTVFDAKLPQRDETFDIFLAIHADSTKDSNANGFSIGYPSSDDGNLARTLRDIYRETTRLKFRGDNITTAMRRYYGFRKIKAKSKAIIECGFLSNPTEGNWLKRNVRLIAEAISAAILKFFNRQEPPFPLGEGRGEGNTPNIEVRLGDKILFSKDDENPAYIDKNGRSIAPLRKLANRLGFDVYWDKKLKLVTLLPKVNLSDPYNPNLEKERSARNV